MGSHICVYTYTHIHIGTSLVLRWLRVHVSATVNICWWKESRNAMQRPGTDGLG